MFIFSHVRGSLVVFCLCAAMLSLVHARPRLQARSSQSRFSCGTDHVFEQACMRFILESVLVSIIRQKLEEALLRCVLAYFRHKILCTLHNCHGGDHWK